MEPEEEQMNLCCYYVKAMTFIKLTSWITGVIWKQEQEVKFHLQMLITLSGVQIYKI